MAKWEMSDAIAKRWIDHYADGIDMHTRQHALVAEARRWLKREEQFEGRNPVEALYRRLEGLGTPEADICANVLARHAVRDLEAMYSDVRQLKHAVARVFFFFDEELVEAYQLATEEV